MLRRLALALLVAAAVVVGESLMLVSCALRLQARGAR
jgi:hypothetical protein